jgi:hypothetical protein
MNRKAIERARADLRRAWQTGDDNLMAAAQLVLLKELRRAQAEKAKLMPDKSCGPLRAAAGARPCGRNRSRALGC